MKKLILQSCVFLDSEWSEESNEFTMVFIFYILYTTFLPEIVLRFQHIEPYILANWIKMVL